MKIDTSGRDSETVLPLRHWWLENSTQHGANQTTTLPLVGRRDCDVLVIGAGYTGLWTALALKQKDPQLDVVVIDSSVIGAGASGLNGGIMAGYWQQYPGLVHQFGVEEAGKLVRAGSRAQDEISRFIQAYAPKAALRNEGMLMVASSDAQEHEIKNVIAHAQRLNYTDQAVFLSPDQVQGYCASPQFRSGILFPESATIDPVELVRALATEAARAGVDIHESTQATSIRSGNVVSVQTTLAEIRCQDVVVATNSDLTRTLLGRPYLTTLSSYVMVTEPIPEILAEMGWTGHEAIRDARMFLHWCRTTDDGRIIFGTGAGPMGFNGHMNRALRDRATVERLIAEFHRVFPRLAKTQITCAWSGPIDMASDHLPWFATYPDTRIHYGFGFSGHGINAAWIAGQTLAALAMGSRDEWTSLALCTRRPPRLPPEPFRYLGGQAIKASIKRVEDAGDQGVHPPQWARAGAALPGLLGLRIGTRR